MLTDNILYPQSCRLSILFLKFFPLFSGFFSVKQEKYGFFQAKRLHILIKINIVLNRNESYFLTYFLCILKRILSAIRATVPYNQNRIRHINHLFVTFQGRDSSKKLVFRSNYVLGKTVTISVLFRQSVNSLCSAANNGNYVSLNLWRQIKFLYAP